MNGGPHWGSAELRVLLAQAAVMAGMPVSVHRYPAAEGEAQLAGCGASSACAHICSFPVGQQRCQDHRSTAARLSLRQERIIPFVCHMGFSCVCIPMSESRSDVITLGPFTTSEDTAALCVQVRQGLEQLLGGWEGELPFSLSDIRVEAMARVYALAATTEASLRAFAGKSEKSPATSGTADREENDARGTAPKPLRRHGASARVPRSSEGPAHLAALLASGDASAVKLVVRGILDEASKAGKRSIPESRARTLALATAVLVASEASGHQTERAWPALDDLLRAVNAAESKAELSKAALRFLKTLMPQTLSKTKDVAGADPALNRAIRARLPGRVLLGEVAKELGRTPGALSHYLRRKYGLTFSDYVGRLRVEEAKRLIRETQLGAGEVGIRVGIVDQSNFAKLFKKVAGCSPREYRLLHGRNR